LDLAKSVGWTDSFRFLKAHPHIPKFYLDNDEKFTLIDDGVIHPILRNRDVPVIPVVFAYKLFGTKILRFPRRIREGNEEDPAGSKSSLADISIDMTDLGFNRGLRRNGEMAGSQMLLDQYKSAHGPLIKDLKNVPEPPVKGADWIYHCALSAAEYNAHLKLERKDRLWGWTKVHDDDNSEDEESDDMMTDSDSERNSVKPKKKKEPQQSVKKNGFFDVHTGINQIPRATQIERIKIETSGITMNDLLRGDSLSRRDCKLYIGKPVPALPPPASNPSIRTILQLQMSSDEARKFPIALMPGQYQENYSM
jgi:hypothetical protein